MAVPWAWAFDTPYKWTKQIPSFFGGTRQGMAISWPARVKDKGGIRFQFHHVIDIVPTILEATGIPAPVMVDGVAQKPIEVMFMLSSGDASDITWGFFGQCWICRMVRQAQYFPLGAHRPSKNAAQSFANVDIL